VASGLPGAMYLVSSPDVVTTTGQRVLPTMPSSAARDDRVAVAAQRAIGRHEGKCCVKRIPTPIARCHHNDQEDGVTEMATLASLPPLKPRLSWHPWQIRFGLAGIDAVLRKRVDGGIYHRRCGHGSHLTAAQERRLPATIPAPRYERRSCRDQVRERMSSLRSVRPICR
jgi:hypothetical protein